MTVAAPTRRTYPCARCGKKQPAHRMIFSRFTRRHFCVDIDACGRRAAKFGAGRDSDTEGAGARKSRPTKNPHRGSKR